MDETSFRHWLDRYTDAWRTYGKAAIEELFTEDAHYRYHPWDEPEDAVSGRAAIVANWLEEPDDPDSWRAEYRPWAVDGDRAVAVGVTRYLGPDGATVDREYHNAFLCRFDSDGRCREFTELYMRRPD